jgi:ribosome-associated protein
VILKFNIKKSKILNEKQKEILFSKLENIIDKTGSINISSQKYRSQLKNKRTVEKKLLNLVEKSLKVNKTRIRVEVSKKMIEKRLKDKRIKSVIKKFRQKHNFGFD